MATGWGSLGEALGGGIDRDGAFEQGRLRTAQTESALGLARQRQLENMAKEAQAKATERLREQEAKLGVGSTDMSLVDLFEAGAGNWDQVTGGRGNLQDQGFVDVLGDKDAALGDQFSAGQALQRKVLPKMNVTGDVYENLMDPAAGLALTPAGTSNAAVDRATENLRNVQAGDPDYRNWGSPSSTGPGPNGIKPPSGYMENPAYNPELPIGEGNYPLLDMRPPTQGSREAVFNERQMMSMAQAIPDLVNTMLLPATANTGIFGIGSRPGESIIQSSVDALRNTLASETVRAYETQSAQTARGLAWIESNGLSPSEAIMKSFESLIIRPGDSGFDALRKLANMRQTVDQMVVVKQSNPRIPKVMRDEMLRLQAQLHQALPFTVEDVNLLQFKPGKYRTLGDVAKEKGLMGSAAPATAPAAPGAEPAPTTMSFATEAEAEAAEAAGRLQKGTRITIGGIPGTWQ